MGEIVGFMNIQIAKRHVDRAVCCLDDAAQSNREQCDEYLDALLRRAQWELQQAIDTLGKVGFENG